MRKLSVLFFIAFLAGCQGARYKEAEPNNSRWDAQLLEPPITLKGEIENGSDADFFKFIVHEPLHGDVRLLHDSSARLTLSLYFQNRLVKQVRSGLFPDKKKKREIVFKNILFQKGIFYISVEPAADQSLPADYRLLVPAGSKKDPEVESEPNDRLVEANYVSGTNSVTRGFFSPCSNFALSEEGNRESDWYCFSTADRSNVLSVEITSVPDIDPVLELYNSMGYLLKKVDSGGNEEPEILKNFGMPESGVYYLRVYDQKAGSGNSEVPYQLYLNTVRKEAGREFEPNDSFNTANPFGGVMRGYINPRGDTDIYLLDHALEKGLFHISVTPLQNIDLKVDVYAFTGERIYTLDSQGKNQGEILPNLFLRKGAYYIALSDASNRRENSLDEYTLKVIGAEAGPSAEYEPNNTPEQAHPLGLNESVRGYLAPRGDRDLFLLLLKEEKNVKIDVAAVPQIDPVLLILDSSGNTVKTVNDRSRGEGESALIFLPAGSYHVILSDAENNSNSYESYLLSVFER